MYTPVQFQERARSFLATLVVFLLAFTLIPAVSASAETSDELLPNPSFAQGTSGWRTNSSAQQLRVTNAGFAELTTTRTGHAVLNDEPNATQNTTKGTTYTVTARLRTTTPGVNGALRIREVSGSDVKSSQTSFKLTASSWQTVTLKVTTTYAGSNLDLNVVAWNLPSGKNLQIDSVSMKRVLGASTPPAVPSVPSTPDGKCEAAPPTGTVFGSSVSTTGQTLTQSINGVDANFGRVGAIRHFSPGMPIDWNSKNAQLFKDRTLVTSFKVAPSEIISGKHDAFFRNWFATAPTDQTIYWSYFHEPENNINAGEYTAAQYRAAWAHLAKIEQAACKPNMHATLILTAWTMNPQSKRDYRVYDAGSAYVKVLAFDPYNGLYDKARTYYEDPAIMIGPIVTKMQADGRPWGIAEIGSRLMVGDSTGVARAKWLTQIGEYTSKNKALFVTYFNSVGTEGNFRLTDQPSIEAWSRVVN